MAVRSLVSPDKLPVFKGESLATAAPPYDFEGVTLRYLPLKANFHTLANFCDDYLNVVPPEIAYFRPAMPFVMLMIVNYGRMSVDVGNLGWTSQNELLFSLPLEWYKKIDGELVFQDAATIAPYIFVDNEASQSAGREVLGWPKVQGWFAHDLDAWARHPRSPREVLTLKTRVFENLYENEAVVSRELLVVEEEPAATFTEFPPDPSNPLNPLISLPKSMTAWSNLATQAFEMMTRMPLRGYADVDREALMRMPDLSQMQQSMGQTLQGNTINLKQMRDAGQPGRACYQAVTNAKMQVTQFHRGGMLGDLALLRGDVSGGFRVRMNRYESQPIIDVLGLEVDEELTHGDLSTAYLRPVMPFWQEMDLRYLEATNICWRTGELDWRSDEVEMEPESDQEAREPHLYNTTGSAGLQVATGPFRFENVTMRVLPLLAEPEKLKQITDAMLPEGIRDFEPWGRYVYMVVSSYGDTYSETNDMGDWADKVVEFAIPVRCRDRSTGQISVGYFSPFMFNSSSIGVTTGREVYGWPVFEGQIDSPSSSWLKASGSVARAEPYLEVSGEVFPALNVGQKGEWRKIIELQKGLNESEQPDWTAVADGWGRSLKADVCRMSEAAQADDSTKQFPDLQALALGLLGNGEAWNHYSYKQFRDAESSENACYQAVVERSTHIDRLHTVEEIEDPLYLKIHSYPTQPIVETLGLVVHNSYMTPTGRVFCLHPSRPFSMHLDLSVDLPRNLCWRSRIDPSSSDPNSFEGWHLPTSDAAVEGEAAFFSRKEPAKVGADLVSYVASGSTTLNPNPFSSSDWRPERLQHICRVWSDAVSNTPGLGMTPERASQAVTSDTLEPQMVVHAALSNEWNNAGDSRLRQSLETKSRNEALGEELDQVIDRLPIFVIRREAVESEADDLFPQDERVANVGSEVDYWSPSKC